MAARHPERFVTEQITKRDLDIIDAIDKFKLITASLLIKFVGGNEDVTHRHLQKLFHLGTISRFRLPRVSGPGEFIYFLDSDQSLELLSSVAGRSPESLDWETVARNRKHKPATSNQYGRALFVAHEVMITRFHVLLEVACSQTNGKVGLHRWLQGPRLWSVVGTEMDGNARVLPHRPDAFFTLKFSDALQGQQLSNFFYEADRDTMSLGRMHDKFLAHYEFLGQGKCEDKYGIKRLRAVLVQTLSVKRANQLRAIAEQVCPEGPLFWFTDAVRFGRFEASVEKAGPCSLVHAQRILGPIWRVHSGEESLSLLD